MLKTDKVFAGFINDQIIVGEFLKARKLFTTVATERVIFESLYRNLLQQEDPKQHLEQNPCARFEF